MINADFNYDPSLPYWVDYETIYPWDYEDVDSILQDNDFIF